MLRSVAVLRTVADNRYAFAWFRRYVRDDSPPPCLRMTATYRLRRDRCLSRTVVFVANIADADDHAAAVVVLRCVCLTWWTFCRGSRSPAVHLPRNVYPHAFSFNAAHASRRVYGSPYDAFVRLTARLTTLFTAFYARAPAPCHTSRFLAAAGLRCCRLRRLRFVRTLPLLPRLTQRHHAFWFASRTRLLPVYCNILLYWNWTPLFAAVCITL